MSKADSSLFDYHDNNKPKEMTPVFVAIFLWSETTDSELTFISKL